MPERKPITFDDIARRPLPGYPIPAGMRFSPDGKSITYLYGAGRSLTQELWAYDRETGTESRVMAQAPASEEGISREEALRRERQRQLAVGVTGHAWSETGDTLLVQSTRGVFVRRGADGAFREVGGGACIDPQLSRDGVRLAFVRDGDLYALDLTEPDTEPHRLTFDAAPPDEWGDRVITNGVAEFVAQEEMGRSSGFWWSRDGALLAFAQVDNTPVPRYFIPHPGTEQVEIEAHRYPFAGKANARVRLGVVPAEGGGVSWLPLPDDEERYLARVNWTPDGLLLAQLVSRDQTRLDVVRIDPRTGKTATLWADEVRPWVSLTNDLRIAHAKDAPPDEYRILWSSERGGRRELYLYDRDGGLLRQITNGEACIDEVKAVDTARGHVYFDGWRESPLERHLFRVSTQGGPVERLTREPGMHVTSLAPDSSCFVEHVSSVTAPPVARVCAIDGSVLARLQSAAPPDPWLEEHDLHPPEFITVTTRDGETLHGAVYRPRGLAAGAKAPLLVDVYGGPHAQSVVNGWGMTVDLRAQYFAQEGYVVLVVDNRGSARRGLAFEGWIHRNAGDVEVRDQADAVRALAGLVPEADLSRVGVYGWSYGGYMALMCLARAGDVFKAAAAGAPVTDWDGYDTFYTERYMGTPENNPDGYRASSVMTHLDTLTGKLLIIHGMIDENVHFRHTGRLVTALIHAGIPHELIVFPEERHMPRRQEDRAYIERRIAEFFKAAL